MTALEQHVDAGLSDGPHSHRWKVLAIGVAANASFAAAFAGIPVTAIAMRADYRLGNAELGLALGLLGLGVGLSELPWGMLTDRWGDRRVLLSGLGATALALAWMAWFAAPGPHYVPSLSLLGWGLLLVGLLGGSVNGSSGRAVMGWFREGERGFAMSIRQTAVPVGGGFGALVLPALAASAGFAFVYALLALLCAISAGFAWWWLHEPPSPPALPAGDHFSNAVDVAPRSALRDMRIWRVALAIGVLCFPQIAVVTFATIFLHDFSHAGLAAISACMVTVQLGAAAMRIWSGRWTDRRGNRRGYLRACSLLGALIFALLALMAAAGSASPQMPAWMNAAIVVTLVAGGICVSAWHGVAYTELATLAGADHVGTALGLGNSFVFLMFFLTAQAVPVLLAWQSWPAVWLAGSACAMLAWPVFLRPVVRAAD